MEESSVLDLVVGLDQEQVRTFEGLAVPVLRELRTSIEKGQRAFVVDLDRLQFQEKQTKQTSKAGILRMCSTKDN